MRIRTYHRVNTLPSVILTVCVVTFVAVLGLPPVASFLRDQMTALPLITLGITAVGPLLFLCWYLSCYAEVQRGELCVRWFWRVQRLDLRRLEQAEVLPAGGKRAKTLAMRLEDARGEQLWLPLTSWRDEDLLMARVLRATVDRRVPIDGDPLLVRRFSGVLDTYKSWDRQLAA